MPKPTHLNPDQWRNRPPTEGEIAAHAAAYPAVTDPPGGAWLVLLGHRGTSCGIHVLYPGDAANRGLTGRGYAPARSLDDMSIVPWPSGVAHPATFPVEPQLRAWDSDGREVV